MCCSESASVDAYRWKGSDWRGAPDAYSYRELREQRPPNRMPDALRDWRGVYSVDDSTAPLPPETNYLPVYVRFQERSRL
jgi:hypothetical protein